MKKIVTLAVVMTFALAIFGAAYATDVTGKVEVKDKVVSIKVSEAKGDDGKPAADLKDKSLKVTGAKVADVEKLAGKTVDAKGKVTGSDIDVASVAEKKAPAPAPAAPAPAPAKK